FGRNDIWGLVAGKRDESARSARGNLTARIVTLGPRLGRKRGFQACPLQSTREVYITGYVVSIRRPFASATKSPTPSVLPGVVSHFASQAPDLSRLLGVLEASKKVALCA